MVPCIRVIVFQLASVSAKFYCNVCAESHPLYPQIDYNGLTTIHEGGLYVESGGVRVEAGGVISNTILTVTAGTSLIVGNTQVRTRGLIFW